MQRKYLRFIPIHVLTLLLGVLPMLQGCIATSHSDQPAAMGQPIALAEMERSLHQLGPETTVKLQTFNSADWVADLSEVLNLDNPTAKSAGLVQRREPMQVYFYALRHPKSGLFLIDTGFSAQMVRDPSSSGVGWVLRRGMQFDQLQFHLGPADVLKDQKAQLHGVFLTHLHPDHIGGLSEIPLATPMYVGPGETKERHWTHFFTKTLADHALEGRPPLQFWNFESKADSAKELAVVDIFGDRSVFALSVPGHTAGSTAYLVRTESGPVLLVGDTCHTRWGWEHSVEPGDSSMDRERNRASLLQLKALVARNPQIEVRFGHQT